MSISTAVQKRPDYYHERYREERRTDATRRINATLAKLVNVERHDVVRQQLLEIITEATGYRYAMLSEMEADEAHLCVVAVHAPPHILQGSEKLLGFSLVGHRVKNLPNEALQTPPTEIFKHIYEWRPEVSRPASRALELLLNIRHIASIRLHTGDYYLGAANFAAANDRADLSLLEYLCNNHLVYALRLIQEQSARERLQLERTRELQYEIQERQQAQMELQESEAAIRALYTITANPQMTFAEKIYALLQMGCQRFGATVGILARVEGEQYWVEGVYTLNLSIRKGDLFAVGQTYCRDTLRANQPIYFENATGTTWANHPCYQIFKLEAYLGTPVHILVQEHSVAYGTLSFSYTKARTVAFKAADLEFLNLMAQWIGGEIARQQQTEQLRAYARQIEETHQKLAVAHDRALEVSRLKSEFLATMSHEIRTPMNGIIGMTELLMTTSLNSQQEGYAQIVLKETDHLLRIINDILDFSKIEAGRLTLEQERFAPTMVVESVIKILSPQATAKGLSLSVFVAPEVPVILLGDANRLRQILLNLVGNAVKFTDEGKVAVHLTLQGYTPEIVQIYCAVIDTGIGIAPKDHQYLFQPFSQIDGGVTRRHGGTGLGLAIAGRLVALMDGDIGVESVPGAGSTFWFTAKFIPATSRLPHRQVNFQSQNGQNPSPHSPT